MDVMRVMRQGGAARRTGKTAMNEHSSRSHLVFTIIVKGVNKVRGEQVCSRWGPHQRASSVQCTIYVV
jgi:kinesin family protein C2/C3